MSPHAWHTISLAFALLATGCAGDSQSSGFAVRDSAGVAIVENARALWTDANAWRLDPEPALVIGVVDGAPEYQLFPVRNALRLDSGVIAVANGGSSEIRFYDDTGRHIRTVGGDGEGSGDFRVISLLA